MLDNTRTRRHAQVSHMAFIVILALLGGGVAQTTLATAAAAVSPAGLAPADPAAWTATAGATTKTFCSLSIEGYGDQRGLKAVQLSCTGGNITARAHKELKRFWGSSLPNQGVKWTEDQECAPPGTWCLLSICGQSDAVFVNTNITAVNGSGLLQRSGLLHSAMCVRQGSKVTLRKCSFTSSTITPLSVYDNATSVLLDGCRVSNNVRTSGIKEGQAWSPENGFRSHRCNYLSIYLSIYLSNNSKTRAIPPASSIFVFEASVVVWSSNFTHNTVQAGQSSTIHAKENGRIGILDSTFVGNTARSGGALFVDGTTRVTIKGSSFEANNATWGGAILALSQARLDILPGMSRTTFVNNTAAGATAAAGAGADIAVVETAALHMTGALLKGGQAGFGGSLALEGNSTASLTSTRIQGARALFNGGCVWVSNNAALRVINSEVTHCRAGGNGGGIHAQEAARLVLINSTISHNVIVRDGPYTSRFTGGGVAATGASRVEVKGATIHSNTGAGQGGGLFVDRNATFNVLGPLKTRVFNNSAIDVGGGLRLGGSDFSASHLVNVLLVLNNSAPTAANISYQATNITVVDGGGADHVIASDSQDTILVLTLNVSDAFGLPSEDRIGYTMSTETGERPSYITADTTTQDNLRRMSVKFKDQPGRYQLVIKNLWADVEAKLNVTIIPCPKGYVTGGRNDTCNPCPQGMYSFNASEATCRLCPANAQCPGKDVVWPEPGFWKSAPQSIQVHRCFNRDACLGATALNNSASNQTAARHLLEVQADLPYKTAQCSGPYQGNLCGQCKEGFGKVRSFHCRKCMPAGAIVGLYLLAAAAMIGLVKLLVYFQTAANSMLRTDLKQPIPAEMLRALVIHTQWLYIIGNLDVPLPQSLLYPVQFIVGIWTSTSGSSPGLECVLSSTSNLPVAVQKVLLCLFTPVGLLCAVVLIEAGMHCLRPRKSGSMGHDFASVVMCIVFMFLPAWVSTALSLFTCVTLDSPADAPYQAEAVGSWWVEDLSQQCYSPSGYHRGWALGLGIPLTLLFCVALPAGVFVFMWNSRKQGRLQETLFQKHYGFMYRLWRDEWCWWEAVVLLQTCTLVMISTLGFALGPFYQTMVAAAVLAWIAMALLAVRPYKCLAAGRVAVISVCVLFFTAYACLSFLPYNNAGPGSIYSNIMGAVILVANVAFLFYTAWLLVRSVDWPAVRAWLTAVL